MTFDALHRISLGLTTWEQEESGQFPWETTYVIGNPGPLTDDEIDALYQEEPLEIGF